MRKHFRIPATKYTRAIAVWFGWHRETGLYFDLLIRGRLSLMVSAIPAPADGKRVWFAPTVEA